MGGVGGGGGWRVFIASQQNSKAGQQEGKQALEGELTNGHQVFNLLGGTKVCQLDPASIVHQDVGSLDVAMHDVVLVQILQA